MVKFCIYFFVDSFRCLARWKYLTHPSCALGKEKKKTPLDLRGLARRFTYCACICSILDDSRYCGGVRGVGRERGFNYCLFVFLNVVKLVQSGRVQRASPFLLPPPQKKPRGCYNLRKSRRRENTFFFFRPGGGRREGGRSGAWSTAGPFSFCFFSL